jgi:hypothetical protein
VLVQGRGNNRYEDVDCVLYLLGWAPLATRLYRALCHLTSLFSDLFSDHTLMISLFRYVGTYVLLYHPSTEPVYLLDNLFFTMPQ